MSKPNAVTIIAARFERALNKGEDASGHPDGAILASAGTEVDWDTPDGMPRRNRSIRVWLAVWPNANMAQDYMDRHEDFLPVMTDAIERFAMLARPVACHGEVNWAKDGQAPSLYSELAPRENKGGPILVMTTLGIGDPSEGLVEFGTGVTEVRKAFADNNAVLMDINMLHDIPLLDGPTLTLWRTERDMMEAAYRTDPHKRVMSIRNGAIARASFTRMEVVACSGAWGGADLNTALFPAPA